MSPDVIENFDYWLLTKKYYPQMAHKGYIFISNIDRSMIEEEAKEVKHYGLSMGVITIDGVDYNVTKVVIVEGYAARMMDGRIDRRAIPVFGKLTKKVIV